MLSKHGLTIDHLIYAKLVDAKGRVLDKKAMGEDLFLAIRGGGGMLLGRIDVLSSTTQLSQVWLHANAFSGLISDLSNCTNLFDLQLRDNQFTGMVPPSLTRLPKLVKITLQNNKLQGPYPLFSSSVQVTIRNTNSFCKDTSTPVIHMSLHFLMLLVLLGIRCLWPMLGKGMMLAMVGDSLLAIRRGKM
ncbi:putative receptor protein kinase TMK1 [Forsythia ovata]|uniref:Receptor protein kinase TMK1 n=1 Tax=Forsythia ovata TaxID=205694 RepID=A0ABD1TTJ6_9LAMI